MEHRVWPGPDIRVAQDGATPEEFHPDTPKPKSEPEAAAPAKG